MSEQYHKSSHVTTTTTTTTATSPPTSEPCPQQQAQEAVSTVVTELNNNDVLLGRGASSSEYSGNLRLRALVLQRREDYYRCHGRNEKHLVAMEIIQTIQGRGGRFLQKVGTMEEAQELGVPPLFQAWKVVQASSALFTKVKQLMRDVGEETQKKRKIRREEKRRLARLKEGDTSKVDTQQSSWGVGFGETAAIFEGAKLTLLERNDNEVADDSSLSSGGSEGYGPESTMELYATFQQTQYPSHEEPGTESTEPRRPVAVQSPDRAQSIAVTSTTDVSALSTVSSASAAVSTQPTNSQQQLATSLLSQIMEQFQRQQEQQQQQQQQQLLSQQAQNTLANLLLLQRTQVPENQDTRVHLPQVLQCLSLLAAPSPLPQFSTSNASSLSTNDNAPHQNPIANSLQSSLGPILQSLLAQQQQQQFPLPPPQPPLPLPTTSNSLNVHCNGENVASLQPLATVLHALVQQQQPQLPPPLSQPLPLNHLSSRTANVPQEEASNMEQDRLAGILLQALLLQQPPPPP